MQPRNPLPVNRGPALRLDLWPTAGKIVPMGPKLPFIDPDPGWPPLPLEIEQVLPARCRTQSLHLSGGYDRWEAAYRRPLANSPTK